MVGDQQPLHAEALDLMDDRPKSIGTQAMLQLDGVLGLMVTLADTDQSIGAGSSQVGLSGFDLCGKAVATEALQGSFQ